jgi:hypothetical protein
VPKPPKEPAPFLPYVGERVMRPGSEGICEVDHVSKDGTEVTIRRKGTHFFGRSIIRYADFSSKWFLLSRSVDKTRSGPRDVALHISTWSRVSGSIHQGSNTA